MAAKKEHRVEIRNKKASFEYLFVDDYTAGYGKEDGAVSETIQNVLRQYGIPLDMTYTGKAFTGMLDYSKTLKDKTILFIHTGGTPLFFDYLRKNS